MKSIYYLLIMFSILLVTPRLYAATFIQFDDFPVTAEASAPVSGGGWSYGITAGLNSKWTKDTGYSSSPSTYNSFNAFASDTYNTEHMGFNWYGFLQITDSKSMSGNSLEAAVTGGKNITTCPDPASNCNGSGLELHNKQTYLDYLTNGQNPVDGDIVVGNPYIYFMNNSSTDNPVHFESSQGTNRLSVYIWMPNGLSIGEGGYATPVARTISMGPYSDVPLVDIDPTDTSGGRIGGHFYNDFGINGGGWIHVMLDGHPQHNNGFSNSSYYPFPSSSFRDIGSSYFTNMYRFYITSGKYNGFETPKFSIYIDDMEFVNDTEPQNNETINGVAILYNQTTQTFEVAFNDKYKNNANSYSTYELRYSFSPITNANWSSATPAYMQEHTGFHILANSNGLFQKWWPYYQSVWAGFKLSPTDMSNLTSGTTVYFAVKDIGNIDSNGNATQTPIDGSNGYWGAGKGGRDYAGHASDFDWAGDEAALTLIKRTSYKVILDGIHILPPQDLKAIQ